MKAISKQQYLAPAMQEVEVKTYGNLCQGSSLNVPAAWVLSGDTFTSEPILTDRSSYGDVIDID